MDASPEGSAASAAQSLFEKENLPFPPVPAHLAASLQQVQPAMFATRSLPSTLYDLRYYLGEVAEQPDLPDYAALGFDGHGTNSWAAHYYVITGKLALFFQLPWGGVYLDPDPARAEITELFRRAAALQDKMRQVDQAGKIPAGLRLQVSASPFSHSGWRWVDIAKGTEAVAWNDARGMTLKILAELDEVLSGARTLAG
jgi:hypothetical protein